MTNILRTGGRAGEPPQLPFFVYGTLLPGQPNFALWAGSIQRLTPATLSYARLYDMGHYPMMVEEPGATTAGVVITVRPGRLAEIMARLDFLEGYDAAQPDAGEYRRVKRVARLNNGWPQAVWVYAGRRAQVVGRPALDESWSAYCRLRERQLDAWWATVQSVGRRSA